MKHVLWAILFTAAVSIACTSNYCAKSLGGTMSVELSPGQKFVTCTWKENEFWYLHRPMRPGETAETYIFQEKSGLGLQEGKVIITESQ